MALEFEISVTIPASPQAIYDSWLDSDAHTEMTGGAAEASAEVGGKFTAWDGYISGENLELEAGKRIVLSWRTTQFEASDPDSRVDILFEPEGSGTKLTLKHTNLPPHGNQYNQGWIDHYWVPLRTYLEQRER